MPQFERRLYDPSDDVRVYDGGEDEYVDEGSRLPLLIAIALVVLASFAGVVWLAYTQGVQRGREDTPRIAAVGPAQTATPTSAAPPRKPAATANTMAARTPPARHPASSAPKPAVAAPRTITAL